MNKIIGALWKKEKDGREYLSGVIDDLRGPLNIAVFVNNRKEADNQPDYNIVISWPSSDEKRNDGSKNEPQKQSNKKSNPKSKVDKKG